MTSSKITEHEEMIISSSESEEDFDVPEAKKTCFIQLNIFDGLKPINQDVLLVCEKSNYSNSTKNEKEKCKILKYSSEWTFEEVTREIDRLDPKTYKNLFVLVIEIQNENLFKTVKQDRITKRCIKKGKRSLLTSLLNFCSGRPMIVQLTSVIQKETKFYFKSQNVDELGKNIFKDIEYQSEFTEEIKDFPSFFRAFLNKKAIDFKDMMINNLMKIENYSLILRFLRTLRDVENIDELFVEISLICLIDGLKEYFIAACDLPFCNEKNTTAPQIILTNSTENETTDVPEESNQIKYFLNQNYKILVNLSFSQKVHISTAASNQQELLYLLLEICDFPFPNNFDNTTVSNANLLRIIEERIYFHKIIDDDKSDDMSEEISDHSNQVFQDYLKAYPHHKYVFDLNNNTAFYRAFHFRKMKLLHKLRNSGFKATEYDEYQRIHQETLHNIKSAIPSDFHTVLKLLTKTRIHNKDIGEDIARQYWEQIRIWLLQIYEIKEFREQLDTVAECEPLKIIFDFEYESISNVDLNASIYTNGEVNPFEKWIIIGAKLADNDGNSLVDKIRGAIAHELCHCAMFMRYENGCKPYFVHDSQTNFPQIVQEINRWKDTAVDNPEDGCDGIISTTFTCYSSDTYHAELIVRVPHILAQFKKYPTQIDEIKAKYKPLFDYHAQIMSDWKTFNFKERENIRKFNYSHGLLTEIKDLSCNIEFSEQKNVVDLDCKQMTILSNNISKLLMLNASINLHNLQGSLFDAHNIFIDLNSLKNSCILHEFLSIVKNHPNIHIYMDCSKGSSEQITDLLKIKKSKISFLVSNEDQCKEIRKILAQNNLKAPELVVNYDWNDLTEECQGKLLKTSATFQNISLKCKIVELCQKPINASNSTIIFSDTELLRLIVDKEEIFINIQQEAIDKNFEFLFQERTFILEINGKNKIRDFIPQEYLPEHVMFDKFVLLSDNAGNGKSWAMKIIANIHRKRFVHTLIWVTLIDLKEFISEFKDAEQLEPEFGAFIADKILSKKLRKFECEIFKNMYDNGNVCILFDGFDEIAPDNAEFVTKLIKSFKSPHHMNQLWIATRNYFQVDLQKELGLNTVYKLVPFTKEEGVNLIISVWMLNDLGKNFKELMKSSANYENYRKKAEEIQEKIERLSYKSIGFPLFYQMIAIVFMNSSQNKPESFQNVFKLFKRFVEIKINIWQGQKGEIRKKESAKVQSDALLKKYSELHQYLAIQSYFPNNTLFHITEKNQKFWKDERIIGCGLVSKKTNNFFFEHETFREYFVADFIVTTLQGDVRLINEEFCKCLLVSFERYDFRVVRTLLNDALNDPTVQKEIEVKLPRISEMIFMNKNLLENSYCVFEENHEKIEDFLIKVLEKGDYEDIRKIMKNYISKLNGFILENSLKYMSSKLFKFIINFLSNNDVVLIFLSKHFFDRIFIHNLVGEAKLNVIEETFMMLKNKLNEQEYEDIIESKNGMNERNLFQTVVNNNNDSEVHKLLWKLFRMHYEDNRKFLKVFKNDVDENGCNALHLIVKRLNSKTFDFVMTELKSIRKSDEEIKEILKCFGLSQQNLLQAAADSNTFLDLHESLWKVFRQYFDPIEILDIIRHCDEDGYSLIHDVVFNKNFEVIKFTIEEINKTIDDIEKLNKYESNIIKDSIKLENILKSRGTYGSNLLQSAAFGSKTIEIYEYIQENMRQVYSSDVELKNIFLEKDKRGHNILHYAVNNQNSKTFKLIIDKLEGSKNGNRIATEDEIKELLSCHDDQRKNILQVALSNCYVFSDTHETLWAVIEKYFPFEIVKIIKHTDEEENNLFHIAVMNNHDSIVELTWNQIEKFIRKKEDRAEFLQRKGKNGKNLLNFCSDNKEFWDDVGPYVSDLLLDYGIYT